MPALPKRPGEHLQERLIAWARQDNARLAEIYARAYAHADRLAGRTPPPFPARRKRRR